MAAKTENNSKKIPLKWRLIAWWQGYDLADIEEKMRLRHGSNQGSPVKTPATEKNNKISWNQKRMDIAQMIWGTGFCGPGGAKNVIDMSKLLALSPKMSAMVIGAGLGGPARVLAEEFGVWISGYDHNKLLTEEGMKISTAKGLEKKAPIIHLDLENSPAFDRQFDRAFSKEFLFSIKNKAPLLKIIYDQLKHDSLFLLSDYVIKDEASITHPDIIAWEKYTPDNSYLITSDAYNILLEKAGFKIRIHEDITQHYLEMINEAWASTEKLIQKLADNKQDIKEDLSAIMEETRLWNSVTKAMRSGELKLYRYLAHKPTAPIR
ncbi:MAG: class I SAM-dependent methyltransferase [Emcibacter sp.]|nr:class I SAM-dependent methyltransferase [Emcibacter sp.]